MDINTVRQKAVLIKEKLGLIASPVGVKFIFNQIGSSEIKAEVLSGHRYCQVLMKARRGQHVTVEAEGIACPAAAAAFGFKPLPEGLRTGKGLMGFGIAKEPDTGKKMFEGRPVLEKGRLKKLYLFPLETAEIQPDIVVIEDEAEKRMWVVLAEVNNRKGGRIESETAVLQAVCVDATLIPYRKQELNISLGCYGCREATDMGANEAILGFLSKILKI
ncbi:MAG: DUF169 domain-containing protein [Candidatus Omnitrophica bacterium]|nr:DUF169 domain-containing protein [Candidatus Omnitrophota bacterium]